MNKEPLPMGCAAKMRELMEETKVKDPDHMCGGAFMTWAWDTNLKWYDTAGCFENHQAEMKFKKSYRAWVEAWKQAKEIDWVEIAEINNQKPPAKKRYV